jgi:hypothetical protein
MILMRTTVRLPDELLQRAKAAAARDGTTLTALIESGLRTVLQKPATRSQRTYPPVSPQVGRQLVDVTKTSELLELLDEDLPLEKRR